MSDAEFAAFNQRQRFEMLLVSVGRVKNFHAAERLADCLTDEEIAAQIPALAEQQNCLLEKYSRSAQWREYFKL